MTFDDFVTSVTQDEYVPKVIDTILGANAFTLRTLGNAKRWVGETLKIPVKIAKSTTGGSFDGYDTFDTNRADTRRTMQFNPKAYAHSVVLSNLEQAVNMGKAQVLSLLSTEMESAQQDMSDDVGTLMYSDGTGNSSKDFTGLAAAVDDGTSVATYGGLSRATYTSLKSTVTALGGAITLAAMATMYDNCAVGGDSPTIIFTTEAVWSTFEGLHQSSVQANYDGFSQVTRTGISKTRNALMGEKGFDALFFRGVPVVKDEKCTAGYVYFLNERYIDFYTLPHPDDPNASGSSANIKGYYSDERVPTFSWTGWKVPVNQDAKIGQFILYGDLINKNPNRSGVITGAT